jgi:hypothetical protein
LDAGSLVGRRDEERLVGGIQGFFGALFVIKDETEVVPCPPLVFLILVWLGDPLSEICANLHCNLLVSCFFAKIFFLCVSLRASALPRLRVSALKSPLVAAPPRWVNPRLKRNLAHGASR